MNRVVELSQVSFAYGKHVVLDDINLTIKQGDYLGIVGPNGGGKTTLLKIILGFLAPHQGQVKVFGTSPKKSFVTIGYVPQYSTFDPSFPITVMGVVLMGLLKSSHMGIWFCREEKRMAYEAMEYTGIRDLAHRRFGNLSGGQRQRALISRALVSNPSLLLLDEPTASVDSTLEKDIYSLLKDLNKRVTIVLVTHDLGIISSYVQQVACVNRYLVVHSPEDLSQEMMAEVYKSPVRIVKHECML